MKEIEDYCLADETDVQAPPITPPISPLGVGDSRNWFSSSSAEEATYCPSSLEFAFFFKALHSNQNGTDIENRERK